MRWRTVSVGLTAGVLGLVLLAGCARFAPRPATLSEPPPRSPWEQRRAQLTPLQHYALHGRIAIQRGQEGTQAQVRWSQDGDSFDLRLVAPLAQGAFLLSGNAAAVTLTAPDGRQYSAPDLDTLMTTHLQWALPVAGARYWVLGLPVPGHPVTQLSLDEQGRLRDLAQDGWRISVLDYRKVEGVDLPRKLFLLGDTLRLRLVINAWTLIPQ